MSATDPACERPLTAGAVVAPSVADIEAIGRFSDPAPRNLLITRSYYELSSTVATLVGPGANWCTFATWASKQAGQTIRGDDLGRKLEAAFVESPTVQELIERIRSIRRAVGRAVDADEVLGALRSACAPLLAVTRVADAVARGNKKVFDEIGVAFARFVNVFGSRFDDAVTDQFFRDLRPGDPPDGQRLLADAFRDYHRAGRMADPKLRAERTFIANLRVAVHEQTRLQPEITEALNAPIPDPVAIGRRLVESLFARRGIRLSGGHGRLTDVTARLLEPVRAVVRRVVTRELMTFTMPDGRAILLGADLTGSFATHLVNLEDPEVVAFVRTLDATPDSLTASGVCDWANLADRMHMILDLFRQQHQNAGLFEPPFTSEELAMIAAGRTPDGRL